MILDESLNLATWFLEPGEHLIAAGFERSESVGTQVLRETIVQVRPAKERTFSSDPSAQPEPGPNEIG